MDIASTIYIVNRERNCMYILDETQTLYLKERQENATSVKFLKA